jgi:hypothetical protein
VTPFEIDILMHYYTTPGDHERSAYPGVVEALADLARQDLLEPLPQPTEYGANWRLTERGEVYCVALTRVPLPVKRWVMPGEAG